MPELIRMTALSVAVAAVSVSSWVAAANAPERHQAVRDLQPVGYWPTDEGIGEVLHDRSGHDNHGRIYQVPWRNGLLDFGNDVYQWAQISYHARYTSRAFSMGGWVFSRRVHKTSRVVLIGQPWLPSASRFRWAGWIGTQQVRDGVLLKFGTADETDERALVDIVSGDKVDALGSVANQVGLAINEWQHLLYTYDETRTGKLYLNGRLVRSVADVPHQTAETPLVIGGDAEQWGVWPPDGRSLDGSVRDLVLFDRALMPQEIERLRKATLPMVRPAEPVDDAGPARAVLPDNDLPILLQTLQNQDLSLAQRAEAALALAAMKEQAVGAVPALVDTLTSILEREGTRLPRIEDLLRNACIRALLDLSPRDDGVRDVLGQAFAKPFLDTLDLSKAHLRQVRTLAAEGRHLEAVEVLRVHLQTAPKLPGHRYWGYACAEDVRASLPLRAEYAEVFFSKGNPFSNAPYRPKDCRPADYTPVDVHNGTTYMTVVERLSQEEVESEFEKSLDEQTAERPAAEAKWSRVRIIRIDAGGEEQEALLEGSWFLFDGRDAKMDGWAVGVDRDGYIHVIGGQHNSPNRDNYLPGCWEKMGLPAEAAQRPRAMYWVSKEPGSLASFEFAGQRDDPRGVPCGSMNYMNFARSPDGTLFLYGRDSIWTWGLYRYDASARSWTGLGGSTTNMLAGAKTKAPDWTRALGATVPYIGPAPSRVLVGAWQPGAYNFNRSSWGVRFDPIGRMHVQMGIWGVGEGGGMTNGPVYAYSDDFGDTFHRADGTRLKLPLTVNPVPGHHADMAFHSTQQWFDLWTSLVRHVGFSVP